MAPLHERKKFNNKKINPSTKDVSRLLESRKIKSSKEKLSESFAIKSAKELEKLRTNCQQTLQNNLLQ